jgi:hypothetical protein
LQDLFQGRCAYCEAWCRAVEFGAVEHYRPKAAVTEDPSHPGYYWLAYDPTNYLPSCTKCNSKGKKNYFPVEGKRVLDPKDELAQEKPFLINPYWDRHCDHVGYFPVSNQPSLMAGRAFKKTERGDISIKTYRLNRDDLVRDRINAQRSALSKLNSMLTARDRKGLQDVIRECEAGEVEFCTAAATEIDAYYKDMVLDSPFKALNLGT